MKIRKTITKTFTQTKITEFPKVLSNFSLIKRNDHENGNENDTNYLILEGTNTQKLLFTKKNFYVSFH